MFKACAIGCQAKKILPELTGLMFYGKSVL